MDVSPSIITVRDEVIQLMFERFGVHKLTKEEKVYRDAMESVSLALEEKGMPLDDILDVLESAIDGFENNYF